MSCPIKIQHRALLSNKIFSSEKLSFFTVTLYPSTYIWRGKIKPTSPYGKRYLSYCYLFTNKHYTVHSCSILLLTRSWLTSPLRDDTRKREHVRAWARCRKLEVLPVPPTPPGVRRGTRVLWLSLYKQVFVEGPRFTEVATLPLGGCRRPRRVSCLSLTHLRVTLHICLPSTASLHNSQCFLYSYQIYPDGIAKNKEEVENFFLNISMSTWCGPESWGNTDNSLSCCYFINQIWTKQTVTSMYAETLQAARKGESENDECLKTLLNRVSIQVSKRLHILFSNISKI